MKRLSFFFSLILICGFLYSQESIGSFKEIETSIQCEAGEVFGTLLLPDTNAQLPIALIISGSGPTDRDGNQPNIKNNCLRYLAEELSSRGICSLRYDKRGIGKSKFGVRESDLRFDDYIKDAQKWIEKLKQDPRFSQIIVIGHSEGSLIGIKAAFDSKADMLVSIAGFSQPADKIILEQIKGLPSDLYDETKMILDSLRNGKIVENVNPSLAMLFRQSVQPYIISWIKYDPSKEIQKLKIPVLIVQGTADIQVGDNNALELVSSNNNAELKIIENMNHVLKVSEKSRDMNIATYIDPDLPISKDLIETIVEFISRK
jgi:hypothetical protein